MIHHYFLFAENVSDLTLARYYAAKEVDFLCIDLDQRSMEQNLILIGYLMEWIEGPIIIGLSNHPERTLELKNRIPSVISFTRQDFFEQTDIIKANVFNDLVHLLNVGQSSKLSGKFLKVQKASQVELEHNLSAFIIQVRPEEKTGIYDFEVLDEIFDAISKPIENT